MTVKRQEDVDIYPDFLSIARGYRVSAERVADKTQLTDAFTRLLADPHEPYLLDVIVAADENVYPMIPAGASYREIIMSAQDLDTEASDQQGSNI